MQIHEEWISSRLAKRPDLTRAQLARTRQLMDMATPDAHVTGYAKLIPGLTLPDANDRHVLAAAIHAKASVIVTNNLKDVPTEILAPLKIKAQTPDTFILGLFDQAADAVIQAAGSHRVSLRNPPKTAAAYLISLESQGLIHTVAKLRQALL